MNEMARRVLPAPVGRCTMPLPPCESIFSRISGRLLAPLTPRSKRSDRQANAHKSSAGGSPARHPHVKLGKSTPDARHDGPRPQSPGPHRRRAAIRCRPRGAPSSRRGRVRWRHRREVLEVLTSHRAYYSSRSRREAPLGVREFDAMVRDARGAALTPSIPFSSPRSKRLALASPLRGAVFPEPCQLVPVLKNLKIPRVALMSASAGGLSLRPYQRAGPRVTRAPSLCSLSANGKF